MFIISVCLHIDYSLIDKIFLSMDHVVIENSLLVLLLALVHEIRRIYISKLPQFSLICKKKGNEKVSLANQQKKLECKTCFDRFCK